LLWFDSIQGCLKIVSSKKIVSKSGPHYSESLQAWQPK